MRHHRREMPLLNQAAELLPQIMGPQFDDRIVRHPLNRPVGLIQRDRDFRSLGEQACELVLKFGDVPLHGNPPNQVRDGSPNHRHSRNLTQSPEFLY